MTERLDLELGVLLASARPDGDVEPLRRRLCLAARPVDWDRACRLARHHGLSPLAFRGLVGSNAAVPPGALSVLRADAHRSAASSLAMTRRLTQTLAVLDAAGVAALAYKGPAQGALAYGASGLRPFSDLDLLVHRSDLALATDALQADGFRPLVSAETARRLPRRGHHDVVLTAPDGTLLELHWGVISPYTGFELPSAPLWERARTVDLGGTPVPTLSATDHAHVVCVHSAKHHWERLEWLTGLAGLLSRDDVDPADLLDRAAATRTRRAVLLGAALAEALGQRAATGPLRDAIAGEPTVPALVGDVVRWLGDDGSAPVRYYHARAARFHLRLRDGADDRVRFVRRAVAQLLRPQANDVEAVSLPRWLSAGYYLVRPVRLLTEAARGRSGSDRAVGVGQERDDGCGDRDQDGQHDHEGHAVV